MPKWNRESLRYRAVLRWTQCKVDGVISKVFGDLALVDADILCAHGFASDT